MEDEKAFTQEANQALHRIYRGAGPGREVIYRGARFRSYRAGDTVEWRFEGWVVGFQRID